MKYKLTEYSKQQQPFVKWYKRTYWSLWGLNTKYSNLLDLCHDGTFEDETTQLMFESWSAGKRNERSKK